jgi:hypothetical protein
MHELSRDMSPLRLIPVSVWDVTLEKVKCPRCQRIISFKWHGEPVQMECKCGHLFEVVVETVGEL